MFTFHVLNCNNVLGAIKYLKCPEKNLKIKINYFTVHYQLQNVLLKTQKHRNIKMTVSYIVPVVGLT